MGEKIGCVFHVVCDFLLCVGFGFSFVVVFDKIWVCRMAMSHHSFSTYTNWWSGNFFRDQTAGWSPEKWCFSKRILPNSHELRFRNYPNLARIVIEVWKVSLLNLLLSKHLDGPWRNCSLLWFTEIRTISSGVQFQPLYVSERGWTLNI